MEINLQIDPPFRSEVEPAPIIQAAQLVLRQYNEADDPALAIVITDNATIQQYNRDYRGIDAPTDVLSFENVVDQAFPGPEGNYLGDIVIAYPVAQKQAQNKGHNVSQELVLLAIHGALHLLGYNHDTAENKARMWQVQHQILTDLEMAEIQPTEN